MDSTSKPSEKGPILATGRRKSSIAQVRMVAQGDGKIIINAKPIDDYFKGRERFKVDIVRPVKLAGVSGYDFHVKVYGGGVTGQAEAIRHGIARALAKLDEAIRKMMRKEGLLTRDDRVVERKKPGRPKARKRFQYSKR